MFPRKTLITLVLLSFFLIAGNRLYHLIVADIYASIAQQKLQAKDYATAEQYLNESLRHNDRSPEYHHLQAQALYAQAGGTQDSFVAEGFLRQAQEHYLKSVELNPHEGNAWLDLAQACWWLSGFPGFQREYENAESYFLKALATDPNNGKFLYAMVNYCLFTPEPDHCLPYLRKLAMVYPNAYQYLKTHPQWTDSLRQSYKEGLEVAAENHLTERHALSMLGFMASEEKDWGSAIACTEELIRRSGAETSSDLYFTLGRFCLQLPDHSRAKTAFLQALKLSKTREQTLQSILSPCIQANDLDLYLNLCKETATYDTTVRNRLSLILGKAFLQGNNLGEAQRNFQHSLQTRETAEARRYLAEIALSKKDWDDAEIQSQRATILDPKNSYTYYLFARSLEAQKKYKSALEAINEAIRYANPPQDGYYEMQGALCWALRDYEAAKEAWKAAHRLVPWNANHLRLIAEAYLMTNDLSNAEQYYMAALEFAPQDDALRTALESVRRQRK
jgi:tetratricopeptide (TPR) repeat protein